MIAKSMRKKKNRQKGHDKDPNAEKGILFQQKRIEDNAPKAYRLGAQEEASSDESVREKSDTEQEPNFEDRISDDDSGLDSNQESIPDNKLENIQVSSLLSDMEKLKEDLINRNEYEKLKEKCRRNESDEDDLAFARNQ